MVTVLTVFDLGLLIWADIGLVADTGLFVWLGVGTSLWRREPFVARDGNVADLGVTLSRSEYFSGAYLWTMLDIRPDWLRINFDSPRPEVSGVDVNVVVVHLKIWLKWIE